MKIKRGIYRHCQGQEYRLTGIARNTETGEHQVVLSQFGPKDYEKDVTWWVCPLESFTKEVEREGEMVPRFELVIDFEPYFENKKERSPKRGKGK